ncbi:MAG TPA: FAD-binding protein [Dehalococcoidia bacterium]
MVRQATLLTDLQSIVGAENVRPGDHAFAVDGVAPQAVVRPATAAAAAEVIRHANAGGLAVIPVGGDQPGGPGNMPSRFDIALDVSGLSGIVEYEPEDLTITCGAGITLGELRQATAAAGQMVAFDPEIAGETTVGGALAADLWGPSRVSLGAPRDFTIGLRVITGDGVVTRAGGRVVKNVAGYDLCKLYVGSLGTLAVITEATFKVQPLPKATRVLSLTSSSAAEACSFAGTALTRGLSLRSALVTRADEHWRLEITLAGSEAAVERSARELGNLAGETTAGAGRASQESRDRPIGVRVAALPSELPALLERLPPDSSVVAYPTLGVARLRLRNEGELTSLMALGAVIEDAPPEVKRGIDVFGREPAALPLMRAIKAQLDPKGVLSPGRFVGRL